MRGCFHEKKLRAHHSIITTTIKAHNDPSCDTSHNPNRRPPNRTHPRSISFMRRTSIAYLSFTVYMKEVKGEISEKNYGLL